MIEAATATPSARRMVSSSVRPVLSRPTRDVRQEYAESRPLLPHPFGWETWLKSIGHAQRSHGGCIGRGSFGTRRQRGARAHHLNPESRPSSLERGHAVLSGGTALLKPARVPLR